MVRTRLNDKKAGPVLPGLNQVPDRPCVDFDALTSVPERIDACKVLLREFLLEKVPLGFLSGLDAEQLREALGNSSVRRLRFCIGRRKHLMTGWASRLAGAPGRAALRALWIHGPLDKARQASPDAPMQSTIF